MPIFGQAISVSFVVWDTGTNQGKTGDAANLTLRWIKNGVASAPSNTPVEVDPVNAPGVYTLALTATECEADTGTLCGRSATALTSVMPITVTFQNIIEETWTNAPARTLTGADNITTDAAPIATTAGVVDHVALVDVTTTNTDQRGTDGALLAAAAPLNWSALAINSSGHVQRVTVVDSCTTNADMRGTENALLASAAPANWSALGITVGGAISNVDNVANTALVDRVTLCDRVTLTDSNTDMRGTDGALLAASAPANWSSMAINPNGVVDADVVAWQTTVLDGASMIEDDGAGAKRYTAKALEQSPTAEATDWTDTERDQIRHRLGVDGDTETPATNQPNLNVPTVDDIWTRVLTTTYAAPGVAPNAEQAVAEALGNLAQFRNQGLVQTVYEPDGVTPAATYVWDSSTAPTEKFRQT